MSRKAGPINVRVRAGAPETARVKPTALRRLSLVPILAGGYRTTFRICINEFQV